MHLVLLNDKDQRFNSPEFYTPQELHRWLYKYKLYGTYMRFIGKTTKVPMNKSLSIISTYY